MSQEQLKQVADHKVDATGKYCADLTPVIKAAMRELESGQTLAVVTDEPSAATAIEAWSRLTGNALIETIEDGAARTVFVLKAK